MPWRTSEQNLLLVAPSLRWEWLSQPSSYERSKGSIPAPNPIYLSWPAYGINRALPLLNIRQEMQQLQSSEINHVDLIKILRPQALLLASKSRSVDPVTFFLVKRGIPQHDASIAATEIWNEAQRSKFKHNLPRLITGWGLLFISVGLTVFTLLWDGAYVIVALGPAALGSAILWGGYLTNSAD